MKSFATSMRITQSRRLQPGRFGRMGVRRLAALASLIGLAACGGAATAPPATFTPTPTPFPTSAASEVLVSADALSDPNGQHATEVEPGAAASGATIVAAFQVARQFVAGASGVGAATSFDGGRTWTASLLAGVTTVTGGAAQSAGDASVAHDQAHGVWLVALLPVVSGTAPYPMVVRSIDGVHFGAPVAVSHGDVSDDKEWVACDNASTSPQFGTCYVAWDDFGRNGLIEISTSRDGGRTWSVARTSADSAIGIGAQAVSLSNGTAVVIGDDFNEASVFAFVSHDGGQTWSASKRIAAIVDHSQGGNLRSGSLISTASGGSRGVYAVWQDCRFEPSCSANDLVFVSSSDGVQWSQPQRIPLDAIGSGVDHFIPSLASDSNAPARVGLSYYAYANAACGTTCALTAQYSESADGGATWTPPVTLSAPMSTLWLARTTQGRMVADYDATVFADGSPVSIFAQASAPGMLLDEATFAGRIAIVANAPRRAMRANELIRSTRPDHPPRHFRP